MTDPTPQEIQDFIFQIIRKNEPCLFHELQDDSGMPDEMISEALEELFAQGRIYSMNGLGGDEYLYIR